ncbi:LysM peptidoglycan-binding domain-containing protein [Hyalangium rubrum]|uniref:LysM peptidoglycan-binding domain-containing protein n=1 Tax=Hyalangium rubrum TaxID=3103134 RepID=A0ABU5H520_9BACT|nr:LysM peptidoglycan-binding domain-containing protein [Hyalangium sp. s54d21]MDY7228574.1 LysM peptidoglycan-binding domain-containing protein [Hyalangium sp. s54d21]
MPSLCLMLVALASVPSAQEVLPMPPPPPGMRLLDTEDKKLLAGSAAQGEEGTASAPAPAGADAPEGTEPEEANEEVESESAELEELRALEGAALDPGARPNAQVLQSLRRLGIANPLRLRMMDVLEEPTLRDDDTPPELPLIRDLANFDVRQLQDRYDIPVEMQPLVAQYIQFFQGPGRKWFRKWVSRSTRYMPMMQPILEAKGLPRDTVYLAMIESGFSAHAYSWAHAAGPWQFIPSTGREYGLRQDFWVDERRDPVKATHAAANYLKALHKDLGHWYLAWAGYNTGGGRVRRMMDRHGTSNFWELCEEKGFAKETQHYVPKLIAAALISKNPGAFGFREEEFEYEEALAFDEVKLVDAMDLDVIARAAGVSVKDVHDLNPELKRWCTPPASEKSPYLLRLPKGSAEKFAENIKQLAPQERLTFRIHKVRRGDTLSQIAGAYGSAPEAILQFNRLKSARALRINAELAIPVPAGKGGGAALERKVAQARRSGVTALRPEEEIPAGTPRAPVATGPIKTEVIGGRTRVIYGVQEGDSLWAIAQRFNVTVEDLRSWNSLPRRKRGLKVGTVIQVWPGAAPAVVERSGTVVAAREQPAPALAPAPAPAKAGRAAVHTLAAGETLWSVAQRYGVSVEDIKRWNNIKDHRAVPAGKQLTVTAP